MKLSSWQLSCLSLFYRVYSSTFRFHSPYQEKVDSLVRKKIPFLKAFFHEELINVAASKSCYETDINALAMTSASNDGDLVEAFCSSYKIGTVRGSSSRNGMKALREIKRRLSEEEIDLVGIAIDGPRGPRRHVKPGIIYLSYLLKLPIVPCRYVSTWTKTLENMWDKTKITLPFSKVLVKYGDPYFITEKLTDENLVIEQEKLKKKLEELEN